MPRVPAARLRGLLLALALAAACAQPAPAPAPPPPPAPPPVAASQAGLDAGLALVDEALALRRRPEQLEEVRPTAAEAVVQLTAAQSAAPDDPRVAVALDTARALCDWQALTEAGWSLSDADAEAWTQAQQAAADALLHLLDRSSGRLAQTSIVRALILLESGRGPEATSELQTALLLFPGSAELHEVLRANADRVSDAPSLATAAERAAQAHADASADCLATAGALLLAAGIQAETAADADAALAHYERAAADLLAVRAAGRARMSDWTLIRYHGDSLVNAASLHLHRAQAVLAESGLRPRAPTCRPPSSNMATPSPCAPTTSTRTTAAPPRPTSTTRPATCPPCATPSRASPSASTTPSGGTTLPSSAARRTSTSAPTPPTSAASRSSPTTRATSTTPRSSCSTTSSATCPTRRSSSAARSS